MVAMLKTASETRPTTAKTRRARAEDNEEARLTTPMACPPGRRHGTPTASDKREKGDGGEERRGKTLVGVRVNQCGEL